MDVVASIVQFRTITALFAMIWLAACSTPDSPDWISEIDAEHSLVGQVWDVKRRQFTTAEAVYADAAAARYVLLGERHDNPDHHVLQARVVEAIGAAGRQPTVVFEMIGEERQTDLAAFLTANPDDSAGIGSAVGWDASGWPAWSTYEPIARAALDAGMPLRAGNLPRGDVRAVARNGMAHLPADRRQRLGLNTPLPNGVEADIRETMFEAHCRLMPREAMDGLISVQRVRDAIMADNMVQGHADSGDGTILIAGNGHVRLDRGVPDALRRLDSDSKPVAIAFMEVQTSRERANDYAVGYGGDLSFDYVWFTPRFDDTDHCAEMKQRMQNRKGSSRG